MKISKSQAVEEGSSPSNSATPKTNLKYPLHYPATSYKLQRNRRPTPNPMSLPRIRPPSRPLPDQPSPPSNGSWDAVATGGAGCVPLPQDSSSKWETPISRR